MRTWLLVVVAVLLSTPGSLANYSIRNPAIRNPVGTNIAPVNGVRGGLFTTPAPIDKASELSITGNLRAGKYFRGNVPYRSKTDFGLNPGTQSLNSSPTEPSLRSFLRDTAGREELGRRSSRYTVRPYYFPNETVAGTVPGRPRVFRPADAETLSTMRRSRPLTIPSFALESLPKQQIDPGLGTMTDAGLRGLPTRYDLQAESLSISDGTFVGDTSPGLREVGRLAVGEAAIRRQDEKLAAQRLSEQVSQSLLDARRELRVGERQAPLDDMKLGLEARTPAQSAADVRDRVAARYRLSPLEASAVFVDTALRQDVAEPRRAIEPELPTSPGLTPGAQDSFLTRQAEGVTAEPWPGFLPPRDLGSQAAPDAEQDDVMARIKQQLDDLARSVESRMQAEPGSVDQAGSVMPTPKTYEVNSGAQPYTPSPGTEMLAPARTSGTFGKVDYSVRPGFESPERPSLEVSQKITSLPGRLSTLSPSEISGQAKRIMGSHKSIDSLSDDKFNRHLRAAEDYLRAGKYYKAADSFALASIYRPDNAQALAGRSHALFAAGEYMSSALFLSRALAIHPDYAKLKIDLVTLLGDRSRLAGRIADVEQWFARSGSPRLQLLLGYVYFQTGRLNDASKAIEAAYTKIPQSPAIGAIKAAIEAASKR